jgi:hypothetical protein
MVNSRLKDLTIDYLRLGIINWFDDLIESYSEDFLNKISTTIFLIFVVITLTEVLADMSWLGVFGFLFFNIRMLPKIVISPGIMLAYFVGSVICITILPLFFSLVIPNVQKMTFESMIVAGFSLYVLGSLWWSSYLLKRSG